MRCFFFLFDSIRRSSAVAAALVVMGLCAEARAGTDLQGTDLQGTDLQGTDLQGTDLQGTDLQGTDLQGTGLRGTRAPDAWLQGARLQGIRMDPASNTASSVEVLGFHGDTVEARLWRPGSGQTTAMLHPRDLIGLQWMERRCRTRWQCIRIGYRIVDVEPDDSRNTMPGHGDNGDLWLYHVEHTTADAPGASDWHNVCRPDPRGLARGLFVAGRWDARGAWHGDGYTFACTSGVVAKCVRNWGYKPWKHLPGPDGQPIGLGPLHRACTRAARADYCGDGSSWTRDRTLVDLFDRHGLNIPDPDRELQQEAGFTPHGAAWVARTRWPAGATDRGAWLDLGTCRRLKQLPPELADRVLVMVRSRPHAR